MSKYYKSSSLTTRSTLGPRSTGEGVDQIDNVHRTSEGYTEKDLQLFARLDDNRQSSAMHPKTGKAAGKAPATTSVQYTEQDTQQFERLMADTDNSDSPSLASTANDIPDMIKIRYSDVK